MLTLIARHIGRVAVAQPVLDEVESLGHGDLLELGLDLVMPETEMLLEAAAKRGALSFEDRICLLLAKDRGWTCVTNDGRLRRECKSNSIFVLWGLEPLAMLVERKVIDSKVALETALAIQRSNPRFITEEIIRRFKDRLGMR
ncbi:MAG: hypothetical protein P9M14_03610 [Candidatus Alcyoniella australis]|nr:hypothetical protein [Candidatus Alcyoniella australis]